MKLHVYHFVSSLSYHLALHILILSPFYPFLAYFPLGQSILNHNFWSYIGLFGYLETFLMLGWVVGIDLKIIQVIIKFWRFTSSLILGLSEFYFVMECNECLWRLWAIFWRSIMWILEDWSKSYTSFILYCSRNCVVTSVFELRIEVYLPVQ
jgi:hypothetical protein